MKGTLSDWIIFIFYFMIQILSGFTPSVMSELTPLTSLRRVSESDTTVMRFLWVEALLIDMHERLWE